MTPVTRDIVPANAYHDHAQQVWADAALHMTVFPQTAFALISGHKSYIRTYKSLDCLDLQ